MGQGEIAQLLGQTLDEEKATDKKLTGVSRTVNKLALAEAEEPEEEDEEFEEDEEDDEEVKEGEEGEEAQPAAKAATKGRSSKKK